MGQYILIMGHRIQSNILVYEVGRNRFYESDVELLHTKYSTIPAVVIENDNQVNVLVNAFIRHCWRLKEFRRLKPLPESLCVFIKDFCKEEMLHFLYFGNHYCISVADILVEK